MIKLESIHIEEFRGIRKLDLDFGKANYAISGPNGSGKSGVIDAIEFVLTGEIKRLTGSGTGGLSISKHGPHVDKANSPDSAFVQLCLFVPKLGKSVKITRKAKSPKTSTIEPADKDVIAALAEVADHPAITLSRRDIIRFILVEPGKRSEEIQSLLKLAELGQTRGAFNTALTRLRNTHQTKVAQAQSARDALSLHLKVTPLTADKMLEAVNLHRKTLNLFVITTIKSDTELDSGITDSAGTSDFNKESALRDLKALSEAETGLSDLGKAEVTAIIDDLESLERDPALLVALQRRALIEKGLDLVDGPECPLCDATWEDEQQLREHLREKLGKSEQARKLKVALIDNGTKLSPETTKLIGLLDPVHKLAQLEEQVTLSQQISDWKTDLRELNGKLTTTQGLIALKDRFASGWVDAPKTLAENLKSLTVKIEAKPDQSATVAARTFLTKAQDRLSDYRNSRRAMEEAKISLVSAMAAYDAYCSVLENELGALYNEVQDEFSAFYRELNGDDEGKFAATFTPSEGSLALEVDFYERGHFPPGAYHSEGHQDAMGVCLYLALMRRLFGVHFTFALLDDVVMSVDSGHRYKFCKLLKAHFPDTQFIITTHDRLWAAQMKSAGLVTAKRSIAFYGWTIDNGPLFESADIWDEIDVALGKGNVGAAASSLRRHLEYASRNLADELGAFPQFRADADYDLGGLLPSVLSRMSDLLGKAASATHSWGDGAAHKVAVERKQELSAAACALNVDQWAVNKAVHYNEWANFSKSDFGPVVAAAKALLEQFCCDNCGSWLYVMPKRGPPEALRCLCASTNLNLKTKPK